MTVAHRRRRSRRPRRWRLSAGHARLAGRLGNTGDEHQRRSKLWRTLHLKFTLHGAEFRQLSSMMRTAAPFFQCLAPRTFACSATPTIPPIHPGDRIRDPGIARAQPAIAGERRALSGLSADVAGDASGRARSRCLSGDLNPPPDELKLTPTRFARSADKSQSEDHRRTGIDQARLPAFAGGPPAITDPPATAVGIPGRRSRPGRSLRRY